jgi:hypothetical protein
MPKYSVCDVLDIIKSLTAEEKLELQQCLPKVLSVATTEISQAVSSPAQNQNMEGITISGSSAIELSQVEADRGSSVTHSKTRAAIQGADLQAAMRLLERLKQEITASDALNTLEKQLAEISRQTLETELNKSKPDKNLIDQAVEALKKGLAGVEVLATPVTKVAELVAKAWAGV